MLSKKNLFQNWELFVRQNSGKSFLLTMTVWGRKFWDFFCSNFGRIWQFVNMLFKKFSTSSYETITIWSKFSKRLFSLPQKKFISINVNICSELFQFKISMLTKVTNFEKENMRNHSIFCHFSKIESCFICVIWEKSDHFFVLTVREMLPM
jgi:hypothetical protein